MLISITFATRFVQEPNRFEAFLEFHSFVQYFKGFFGGGAVKQIDHFGHPMCC